MTAQAPSLHSLLLLRALIPSWRFFDVEGPRLTLRLRAGPEEAPGPWRTLEPAFDRRARRLLFNPHGNESLAIQSLVEQAASQSDPAVPVALLAHACRAALASDVPRAESFQLMITSTEPDGLEDEVLVSPWLPADA